MTEYRTLPQHPGYRIGDDGSVWSEWSPRKPILTGVWRKLRGHQLKYGHVLYYLKSGSAYGHRLVLEAFVGPCPPGLEGCHKNGNPTDNRLENVRWGTSKENGKDCAEHGTSALGGRYGNSKLTPEQVREIFERRAEGKHILAAEFGTIPANIAAILNGLTWNHVTGLPVHPMRDDYRERSNKRRREKRLARGHKPPGAKPRFPNWPKREDR